LLCSAFLIEVILKAIRRELRENGEILFEGFRDKMIIPVGKAKKG
jgi:hypothetical protein